MVKDTTSSDMSTLARKRRADIALTMSELHQRQRRRIDPTVTMTDEGGGSSTSTTIAHTNASERRRYGIDSGIITLLKKYSIGTLIDHNVAEQLLYNPYEKECPDDERTGGRLGQLMVDHPLT